jgi:hypothetical protein
MYFEFLESFKLSFWSQIVIFKEFQTYKILDIIKAFLILLGYKKIFSRISYYPR